ncbi:EamA-like transporter family protein [Roseibium hamelinense]|uniref:EamA-like transporter family protein n=1 Tax=Roseibium hamelinense TaxID=150831 RepID=A0A562T1W1_9HYPH|nr:DMT family transporter [Roseibium hamelinense]MTI42292.1 DMT family transporter [Roseibium hamelinense]TWI87687.1 EamA-like transporter family protein [Roseibium hamelinense]
MSLLATSAALGASTCWAFGSIVATEPSRRLGTFAVTRLQLIVAAPVLVTLVSAGTGWASVNFDAWPSILLSALVGVLLGNLALMACLKRGGPRRMQLLLSLSPLTTMFLSWIYLAETISLFQLIACLLTLSGIAIAVGMRGAKGSAASIDGVSGSIASVIFFGTVAAFCQGFGLIVLKPVMEAGTEPLVASYLRTGLAAIVIFFAGLLPLETLRPSTSLTPRLLFQAVVPGLLGYVVAVSLLLYGISIYHSGVVAVLGATAPVIMLPLLWLLGTRDLPPPAWVGAALTVTGTGVLLLLQ